MPVEVLAGPLDAECGKHSEIRARIRQERIEKRAVPIEENCPCR
jgi:hypothetical protein